MKKFMILLKQINSKKLIEIWNKNLQTYKYSYETYYNFIIDMDSPSTNIKLYYFLV